MHDAMHPTGIFGHINKKQDTGYDQYYPADTSDNPEVFAPSIEGMKAAGITIVPEKSKKKDDSEEKEIKYADEVAPNGEHYSENDLNYLLNLPAADNGFKYTRETALEELSKSKKYAKKSEDKNKNLADIIDKISKRAQAIQANGNEIVIAEDADTAQELADNINAAEEAIPYPVAKAPIQNQPAEEDEEQEENTDYGTGKDNTETQSAQPVQQSTIDDSSSKLDALLQAQNRTNELLSGIFQFLQVAVKSIGSNGSAKSAEKPVMSPNTHTKETPTTMATRTVIATNQNTGIGDFSGDASKDFVDKTKTIKWVALKMGYPNIFVMVN